ncbi:hypothetical protein T265_11358 [Opisthorchis viverrini]|uniref:Uncharacterized protein n=1 Tax=Opisthorchis viverrini TaxID=6198 RepID=A0A074Z9T0_OPIVI|nr:hypothetical protein T265_11358 [Opisthorchis viverrini]KER20000.1 hypothetical protein T265_11358 [Opisthorchis viverrini]
MDGTLDGANSGNPEVMAGSTKEFQCDLVPLDAAESLNGIWKASVQPAGAAVATELEGGKRVKITQTNAQGYQNQPSSFTVSCRFSTPDGTEIVFSAIKTSRVPSQCRAHSPHQTGRKYTVFSGQ